MALAALIAMLALSASAQAATITVNSTSDAAADDGVCALREAITAANTDSPSGANAGECPAGTGADTINFANPPFDGTAGTSTITTSASMGITQPVTINGGNCGSPKPCVGIRGDGSSLFTIIGVSAPNVTINGVAIHNAFEAIGGTATATGLAVRNSWFGIKLDQVAEAVGTGVSVRGDGATIGGTLVADRNVFAYGSTGLQVAGADNTLVRGNYFGTLPDGGTTSGVGNVIAIHVAEFSGSGVPIGTVIGGADSGTPTVCDGACNVISNSAVRGIELSQEAAVGPAGQTTIQGNFVGLDVNGTTDISGTADRGVSVGGADNITIGGTNPAERNYILDAVGVSDAGATNLVVRGNFVGLNSAGTQRLGNGGIVAATGSFSPPFTGGATVEGNRVATTSSFSIVVGDASGLRGNVVGIGVAGENVGGAQVAVLGNGNTIGGTNADESNVIANSSNVGIFVGGSSNTITGNRIGTDASESQSHPVQSGGISVNGGDDNTIGGTTAAAENVIKNVTSGDAIAISGDGTDRNRILRNRGSASAGRLFAELTPTAAFGNDPASGPNDGIQAPTISVGATSEQVSGTGARPGAIVRVYRTATPNNTPAQDVIVFVGEATADSSGGWNLTCPSAGCAEPLPGGGQVTANQTDVNGNGSEFARARSYANLPPNTSITSGPNEGETTNDKTPTFGFSATESGATFECRFDSQAFAPCSGPGNTHTPSTPLSDSQHTFEVRAIDPVSGTPDPTPASRTFRVEAANPETILGSSGPAEGATTNDNTPTFDFSSNEQGTFECRFDSEPFSPCSGPGNTHTPATPLSDGQHTFEVRAVDQAGNRDPSPASRTFLVSTAPPGGGEPAPEPGPEAKADRTLTLDANKPKVEKGRKVRLSGQLEAVGNDPACEAAQTVEILRSPLKGGSASVVTTVQTDAQGNFATKLRVRKSSLYSARVAESPTCEPESSNTEKVRVQKPSASKEA